LEINTIVVLAKGDPCVNDSHCWRLTINLKFIEQTACQCRATISSLGGSGGRPRLILCFAAGTSSQNIFPISVSGLEK
jgi:hypothetical protein